MSGEFNNTKFQVAVTMILVLFMSVTGATYAYFAISASNNVTITGTAATVNLTLNVDKKFPLSSNNNTGVLVPQLSTSLERALKSGCVDGNLNVVCQVYEIKIKNDGGTAAQVVDGIISFYGNADMTIDGNVAMPNLRWKQISSIDLENLDNSVLGNNSDLIANFNKNIFADNILLKTNDEEKYYIIVWIDETNEDQPTDEGSSFYGKVEFNSANGTGVTSTFTP